MKIVQCAHGSRVWMDSRLGIPCASEFHRILTPGGKASAQASAYRFRLIAEWYLGKQVENYESQWMQRGIEMESSAVTAYELENDCTTDLAAFFTRDDEMAGCTPDRLVGEDRLLEIKCGLSQTQVEYLLTAQLEDSYKVQLQGQLYITERASVDIFAYHPELPSVTMHVNRDEEYIKKLDAALNVFIEELLKNRQTMIDLYGPPVERKTAQEGDFDLTDSDVDAIIAARKS